MWPNASLYEKTPTGLTLPPVTVRTGFSGENREKTFPEMTCENLSTP